MLRNLTDRVATRKGAWIAIIIWILVMVGLSAGPQLSDYKVTNFQSLPDETPSVVAQEKLNEYFPNDQGTPGIYVFHKEDGEVDSDDVLEIVDRIEAEEFEGIAEIVNLSELPEFVLDTFVSEDGSTMFVPVNLEEGLGNAEYASINDATTEFGVEAAAEYDIDFYITGPSGIAGDTVKLFESADFTLLIATVGIILVLLIIIYRSPLLAIIPLFATAIVYQVTNQSVAIWGANGLEINNQTTSIMSILLFAAVIDYSLFVFSRYREELYNYEDKFEAMKVAMRSTAKPVLFAGSTVFAAMIVLYFADFREYQNFAPVFGTALLVIMIASVTLVPALFALAGRKAFWPKTPKFGDGHEEKHSIWGPLSKFVVGKPIAIGSAVMIFLIVTGLNVFNLDYEFNSVKSFPEDLPSRVGFEIMEENFDKGNLAQTNILVSGEELTQEQIHEIGEMLVEEDEIASARPAGLTEDAEHGKITVSLDMNPYSREAIDYLGAFREENSTFTLSDDTVVDLEYAGMTAELVDEQEVNNSDIIKIALLETGLILVLLFFLTRSIKMSVYMIATILMSYVAALGLGLFLVDVLFGYDAISTRAPVYAFIFLVALGVDYNIILVSRFLEERKTKRVKDALEIALRNTGGVISSAGIILAATFAALMTMPISDLFVFGFIVALGIIIDTFLVRGMLLPSIILLLEKDKKKNSEDTTEEVK